MSTKRTTPHRVGRRARMIAMASGLLAVMATAAPAASADPGPQVTNEQLARASDAVRSANIGGTAWHIDREAGRLEVTVDSTVTQAAIKKLKKAAGGQADLLRVERTSGRLTTLIQGGDAIHGGGARCSLGFNVRRGGRYAFLTAGHCTNKAGTWYAERSESTELGRNAGSSYPGDDYGVVRYTNRSVAKPGSVTLYNGRSRDITHVGLAYVGQPIQRSGSTTGLHSGTVTALNATVNYGDGQIVSGLIRTDACAEPGDSGGPLFSGTTALGLTSGGSGDCTSGGTTYFQPVVEALSRYGVRVY